jgi:hypothetical protein
MAVTVYDSSIAIIVGVPEITPVAGSSVRPPGNEGTTEKINPSPKTEGVKAMIVEPTINTFGELYERPEGATSLTVITTSNETLPPELVAVTVYEAIAETSVGIPEMTPVAASIDNPVGSEGETENVRLLPDTDGLSAGITELITNTFGEL